MKTPRAKPSRTHTKTTITITTPRLHALLLAALAFVLYAQTLTFHEYVGDDGSVIVGNKFVQQGFAGIPELLTHDSFYGYDVQHNRQNTRKTYRPLSLVSFAVERSLFGGNLHVSHFIHLALYAALVAVLYFTLRRVLAESAEQSASFTPVFTVAHLPFVATLLFALHPVHTEVVANLKSRDELFSLLFALAALMWLFNYVDEPKGSRSTRSIVISCGFYALALLSKENAITWLPVFPLALWVFRPKAFAALAAPIINTAPLLVLGLVYLVVWFGVFGRVDEALYEREVYNPFVTASLAERTATATQTMGLYMLKAVVPLTLSTGYTYNELPLTTWSDWRVLLSALVMLGLLGAGVVWAFKRHLVGFCVLMFFSTMAIASNYFVYAGGLLGERFLFTPSVAVALVLAWLLGNSSMLAGNAARRSTAPRSTTLATSLVVVLCVGYAVKTFSRTSQWQSTYTLLKADTETTPNSIILKQLYAGLLLQKAAQAPNAAERGTHLREAYQNFHAALSIDARSLPQLYNGLGNYFSQTQNLDSALWYYHKAYSMDTNRQYYRKNIAAVYLTKGSTLVEQQRFSEGIEAFQTALLFDRQNDVAYSNIGATLALQQRYDSALVYLRRALELNPELEKARRNLEICERKLRQQAQ
jgi:lipoprotein NlpI